MCRKSWVQVMTLHDGRLHSVTQKSDPARDLRQFNAALYVCYGEYIVGAPNNGAKIAMNMPNTVASTLAQTSTRQRGCLFVLRRGLKWAGLSILALLVMGVLYQTVASALDKRLYTPRGQLY